MIHCFRGTSRSLPVHWLCTVLVLTVNVHTSIQQAQCKSPPTLTKTVLVGESVAISLGNRRCRVYTCRDEGNFGLNLEYDDHDCNSVSPPADNCDDILNADLALYGCCRICGEFRFLQQPAPYYYVINGSDITIPCKIEDAILGSSDYPFLRDSSFFRNGIRIMPSSFQRYVLQRDAGKTVGLTIRSANQEDHNLVVHCTLQSGQLVALRSRNATIYVGDGTPRAPSQPPLISSVTVRSATVEWVASITIAQAPVLSYTIYYWSVDQSPYNAMFVETPSNATTFTIMPTPGFSYFVTVSGKNSVGLGTTSARATVIIPLGEVPPAPENLMANYKHLAYDTLLTLTWQSPTLNLELMTPITEYRIFFTLAREEAESLGTGLVATVEGDTTSHRLIAHEEGMFLVGVAAVNAAGQSNIAHIDIAITLEKGAPKLIPRPRTPPATLGTQPMISEMPSKGIPGIVTDAPPNEVPLFSLIVGMVAGVVMALIFFGSIIVVIYRFAKYAKLKDIDSDNDGDSKKSITSKKTLLSSNTRKVLGDSSSSVSVCSYKRTHDNTNNHTGKQTHQSRVRRKSSAPVFDQNKEEPLPKYSRRFKTEIPRTPKAVSEHTRSFHRSTQSMKTSRTTSEKFARKQRLSKKRTEGNAVPLRTFSKKGNFRAPSNVNALPEHKRKSSKKGLSRANTTLVQCSKGSSKEDISRTSSRGSSFSLNVM